MTVGDICKLYNQPQPVTISESGRSLTAHHARLVTNVIGTESYSPEDMAAPWTHQCVGTNKYVEELLRVRCGQWWPSVDRDLQRHAEWYRWSAQSLYARNVWIFSIVPAEQMSLRINYELSSRMSTKNRYHRPILMSYERLADKFFVNFSLFQSLLDAWGIDQVFPYCPVSTLIMRTSDAVATISHVILTVRLTSMLTAKVLKWLCQFLHGTQMNHTWWAFS